MLSTILVLGGLAFLPAQSDGSPRPDPGAEPTAAPDTPNTVSPGPTDDDGGPPTVTTEDTTSPPAPDDVQAPAAHALPESRDAPATAGPEDRPQNAPGPDEAGPDEAGPETQAVGPQAVDPKDPRHSQPRADNAQEQGGKIARGSIEICDTLTAPLGLIPSVGSAIGFVLEWACLIPGALAMDYTQLYHGEKEGFVWEAGVSLVLAKLWRDLTRWPVVIGISAFGITAAAAVIGLALTGFFLPQTNILGVPPEYAPVALTGILVGGGATFIVMRKLRKWGQRKIFDLSYDLLTSDFDSPEERAEAQAESFLHPPLNGSERLWALAAMAGGSDAERSWWYMIPVVGRYGKAQAMSEALKTDMRQVARDGLHEDRDDDSLAGMDTTIDVLAYSEGTLAALADVLLIIGGAAFFGGSVVAAASFGQTQNLQLYAGLLLAIGAGGVLSAGTGVMLLLAREIPRFLRPILVPVAYGVMPEPGTPWFFDDEEADPPSRGSSAESQPPDPGDLDGAE